MSKAGTRSIYTKTYFIVLLQATLAELSYKDGLTASPYQTLAYPARGKFDNSIVTSAGFTSSRIINSLFPRNSKYLVHVDVLFPEIMITPSVILRH